MLTLRNKVTVIKIIMMNPCVFVLMTITLLAICSSAAVVKEPSTHHSYDSSITGTDDKKLLSLVGLGVRLKSIGPIKAKVYSVGLYLDQASARGKLKAFRDLDIVKLVESKDLSDTLIEGSFAKSLLLKMARNVGADTMVNALADSVKPRLGSSDGKALDTFQSFLLTGLKNGGAKVDTTLRFDAPDPRMLNVLVDGVPLGSVNSPGLVRALFGVYLDRDAVSPSLKQNIASSVSNGI